MLSNEELLYQINSWLNESDEAGEKAGGSGHLSMVSFSVDKILRTEQMDDGLLVEYEYTRYIESEFTYYPDNPPYEDKGNGTVIISKEGIIKEIH